ncbi:MAG: bifunctional alpha/beta hydrolase/OsmC family protein [Pseudomonadota bacterium]
MKSEKLEFSGHAGDTLAARFDMPVGKPQAVALFAHCFTCSKDIAAARRIAGRLAALGIAVLRFDFTGLGHSGGEFANTHFSSNVEDLLAAAKHLASIDMAPDLLIGHSLGGAAVLAAAGDIPSARGVVTIGAPYDPGHVVHNFGEKLEEIAEEGIAEVTLSGRTFTIKKDFLDDLASVTLAEKVAGLKRALLILHAPRDTTVAIDNAGEIFAAAKHPKSFVTLDNADHLLSRAADAEYAAEVIAAWSQRYLDLEHTTVEGVPENVVRVSELDPGGFLQSIAAGPKHRLLADEPTSYGGTDLGPTPYGFLAAGLGACTAMTIRMYARRKGWALHDVTVDVSHDKIHAEDCARCETTESKIDVFRRVIRLDGDLDDEQRTRLMEIADKCPVHRSFESTIRVETEAA